MIRADERLVRRYLLGQCSEDECSGLEAAYFAGSDTLDHIEEAEAELIQDYLAGRLSDADRQRFEQQYLDSPARRERVLFFQALDALIEAERKTARAAPDSGRSRAARWAWVPIAASVLLALGAVGLLGERVRLRRQIDQLEGQVAALRSRPDPRARDPQESSPAATAPSLPLAVLLQPALRGESEPRGLALPASVQEVEIRLAGDLGRYPAFEIRIETAAGAPVWAGPGRRLRATEGESVVARVPADRLPKGDLAATLTGLPSGAPPEDLHRYSFRVSR